MFTIARFFWLKCIHIGYLNILSLVGIKQTLDNFFYWLTNSYLSIEGPGIEDFRQWAADQR